MSRMSDRSLLVIPRKGLRPRLVNLELRSWDLVGFEGRRFIGTIRVDMKPPLRT
jgi:hypothetical protein